MVAISSEIEQLIAGRPLIANLASAVESRPHVAPLWYHYDEGTIRFTTAGKKVRNVRRNPRVAVAIQEDDGGHPEWMVLFEGEATVVDDVAGIKQGTRNVYEPYLGTETSEWDAFWRKQVTDPDDERFVIEVDIHSVASKRF